MSIFSPGSNATFVGGSKVPRGLLKPPQLRIADNPHNRRATWLELFYDLVFVAALAQLATAFSKDYSFAGLARIAVLYVPIWWAWVGQTVYSTRFDTDDLSDRLLTLLQMVFVASLALHIPKGLGENAGGFALSYACVRAILVWQYAWAARHVPKAASLARYYARGFGLAALLWAVSAFVPSPWRFGVWALAFAVDIGTPFSSTQLSSRVPPHYSHTPERFGLFTIIVLGEAVVSVVNGLKNGIGPGKTLSGAMAFVVAMSLWWAYFDGVGAAEGRALDPHRAKRYQVWFYGHLPFTIGITTLAVGVKHLLALEHGQHLHAPEGLLMCVGLATCTLCLTLIYLNSPNASASVAEKQAKPHFAIAAGVLLVGMVSPWLPSLLLMTILCALSVVQTALVVRQEEESRT